MRTLVVFLFSVLIASPALAGGGHWGHGNGWGSYRADLAQTKSDRWERHRNRHADLNWSKLNSGVCDELRGASRGLRLMCMAFCELQSCQPDYTLDNPFESCAPSSRRILARYEKRRGAGDPPMPCLNEPEPTTQVAEVVECPCWTSSELAGLRMPSPGNDLVAACYANITSAGISNYDSLMISNTRAAEPYDTTLSSVGMSDQDGSAVCSLVDTCADGSCLDASRYLSITPEQHAACEADVAAAAANRGLACQDLSP